MRGIEKIGKLKRMLEDRESEPFIETKDGGIFYPDEMFEGIKDGTMIRLTIFIEILQE